MNHGARFRVTAGLFLFISVCRSALGQKAQTGGEFWPAIDGHFQFSDNMRLLALTELKQGAELSYQQLDGRRPAGAWLAIAKRCSFVRVNVLEVWF